MKFKVVWRFQYDTYLHCAVQQGNLKLIEELIQRGADLTTINADGDTPFMLAVANGSWDVIKLLWKYRDRYDLNKKNKVSIESSYI